MIFNDNISKILTKKKYYYSAIINGLIEQKTNEYLLNKEFKFFSLSEINPSFMSREHIISFELDGVIVDLNSSQAMQISAMSAIYNKVYSINRCFRREKEVDSSHLLEFKMLELEFQISDEEDIFEFIEDYLKYIIDWFNGYIVDNDLVDIFKSKSILFPIERKEYDSLIQEYTSNKKVLAFDNFSFCDSSVTKDINTPLYVTYYPSSGSWRAKQKDWEHSYIYNLILPDGFGELIEFSIRETNYEFYKKKFDILGYTEYYKWYLEAIKTNQIVRAGLGLGIERLGSWLMDLEHICDQVAFPRLP